jgi:chromosome segregation ATPase
MKCDSCKEYCDEHYFIVGGRELCPKCAFLQKSAQFEKELAEERQKWVDLSNELIEERERASQLMDNIKKRKTWIGVLEHNSKSLEEWAQSEQERRREVESKLSIERAKSHDLDAKLGEAEGEIEQLREALRLTRVDLDHLRLRHDGDALRHMEHRKVHWKKCSDLEDLLTAINYAAHMLENEELHPEQVAAALRSALSLVSDQPDPPLTAAQKAAQEAAQAHGGPSALELERNRLANMLADECSIVNRWIDATGQPDPTTYLARRSRGETT